MKRHYGYIPDYGHKFDRRFSLPSRLPELPPVISVMDSSPALWNQQQLPFCVGNSVEWAMRFALLKAGVVTPVVGSRSFICYNARELEGNQDSLTGCMIRNATQMAKFNGVCSEELWPYVDKTATSKPPEECYKDAPNEEIIIDERLDDSDGASQLLKMKACLFLGFPVIIGISVYESFESDSVARTGQVPLPGPHEKIVGGHAICLVKTDDNQERGTCTNWWGGDWGMNGFFTLPFELLDDPDFTSDCWKISAVGSVTPSTRT